jgi:cobalt/nickel transport system permease protein
VNEVTDTPDWLVQGELALCPCGCIGKRKKGNYVEKTINGVSGLLRQAMFTEEVAGRAGLLQRVDPRVKIVSLFSLLVIAALLRSFWLLIAMYAGTLVLAATSRLSLGFFVKRVWLFIPIFTGIVVIPAAFSFITPGNIVVPLWTWNGQPVGLTEQGLTSVVLIVSRVAVSISLVVLLTLTTTWVNLLAGLRALHVPKIFILIIGMAYRYLFFLLNAVTDMYAARRSRTIGNAGDSREGRRFVAASAGALFGKSYALSEEVHQAMVSRGYTGDPRTLTVFEMGVFDRIFAASCVAAAALLLVGDHVIGG